MSGTSTTLEAAPEPEPEAVAPEPETAPSRPSPVVAFFARYWATTLIVGVIVVAGVVTGALWHNVETGSSLYNDVAYGLPALKDGKIHTFLFGMFFAPQLFMYVPILALLVLVASIYERRVGHVRTLVVAIGGQFLAALFAALFLWIFESSGWTWAVDLGKIRDLGISAGGFALVGALDRGDATGLAHAHPRRRSAPTCSPWSSTRASSGTSSTSSASCSACSSARCSPAARPASPTSASPAAPSAPPSRSWSPSPRSAASSKAWLRATAGRSTPRASPSTRPG